MTEGLADAECGTTPRIGSKSRVAEIEKHAKPEENP